MKKLFPILLIIFLTFGLVFSLTSKARAVESWVWPDVGFGTYQGMALDVNDWGAAGTHLLITINLETLYTKAVQLDPDGIPVSVVDALTGDVIWPRYMYGFESRRDPVARVIYINVYGSHLGDFWRLLFEIPFFTY